MNENEKQTEDKFRDSLTDVLVIVKRLAPHCKDMSELVGILEHAIENDGQLRFLMSKI